LGDATRIAIEVSSEFQYRSDRLANPDRLFFDIKGAKPEMVRKGTHVIAVGDALLKQIRVAETQPGVTRVVLDLEQYAEFTASQLSSPGRLMIELRLKDHPSPPAATSVTGAKTPADPPASAVEPDLARGAHLPSFAPIVTANPMAAKVEPRKFVPPLPPPPVPLPAVSKPELLKQPSLALTAKPPKVPLSGTWSVPTQTGDVPASKLSTAEPVRDALPAKGNANGGRSLTRVLGLKLGRVVLDPGHGGHDVGTRGPSGMYEKDVVLDVAQRLGALLEERLGSEVIYTRSDDTYVGLEERTKLANDRKADLFLSIHANSSPYRTVAGVETYYLNFTTSRAALDVAARENAGSSSSVFDLKELLEKIALKDKIDESREFASRLQTALYGISAKGNTASKDRGVKKAPFVVLIGASMPSVLAEIAFPSNSADEALLRKPEHRQKLAEALYKGIANYAETLSHFQLATRN
jgi:N-acetylmuramoyl-L-alanine amidase